MLGLVLLLSRNPRIFPLALPSLGPTSQDFFLFVLYLDISLSVLIFGTSMIRKVCTSSHPFQELASGGIAGNSYIFLAICIRHLYPHFEKLRNPLPLAVASSRRA